MFKTISEIKEAVDEGKTVYWKTTLYEVRKLWFVKQQKNDYYVICKTNNSAFGLSYETEDGEQLNGKIEDYFTK